ncbi:MAG: pyruvate, phosphate dikinase [Ignavibacteriae bacterium]|nr:pyruvate, phosphate dikinase [Ignavibacteriota bacterium]
MYRKYIYTFGGGKAEGHADMKALLGGKGANLAEMTNIGLPVPPGFTITTEMCTYFYQHKGRYPKDFQQKVLEALHRVEKQTKKKFGDPGNPLLVSVRSGARASMPGMMDTILNLGLNDETVKDIIALTRNERFGYDSYRRLVQMYGDVVLGLKPESENELDPFETLIQRKKRQHGNDSDTDLTADDLYELIQSFKEVIRQKVGVEFPQDPHDQLWAAITAVFKSWMNERAIAYRRLNNIPEHWGTAVNVQAMVFGNMGENSGTGVAFTRNPATGENEFYGEFLINAQGEDVVAGVRTPLSINLLAERYPNIHKQLLKVRNTLESRYREMQDFEFTIEQGKLYMLQTRSGKRTGFAAVRIATDMVAERLIKPQEALLRLDPEQLNQLLRPVFDTEEKAVAIQDGRLVAKGLNAGPGAATGKVVFSASEAEEWKRRGERVILVRVETSPEDIKGMDASEGILTARGGMTSHAALVARQMGKVCVAGCGALNINYLDRLMSVNSYTIRQGDYLSIDGTTGEVILGALRTTPSDVIRVLVQKELSQDSSPIYQAFAKLMKWSDQFRTLKVRTNADQPDQSEIALAFGAEGIGLCRTEHMFFGGDRIDAVREMILAEDETGRRRALAKLLPMQRNDFVEIFRVMKDRPVTIRTLDPPLHEFLPHTEDDIQQLAAKIGLPMERVTRRIAQLKEFNPMLGNRGCRLGIVFPEITEMQARAIFEAACRIAKEGIKVHPEVMIPLVGFVNELRGEEQIVRRVAEEAFAEQGIRVDYLVGTMIELPRAAVTADEIAAVAEFFSFGTNDLTQTTLGLSRDDSGTFLPQYLEHGIFEEDPFQTLDQRGVGALMEVAVRKGRSTRKKLKIGICGEHGGDPKSIAFCARLGLDYVSCSPYRIPIARLSAAQASLQMHIKNSSKTRG